MIGTEYLLSSYMENTDGDIVFLTIKLTRKLRVEFKAAAKVDEMDVSNALRQFMNQTVRNVKERDIDSFNSMLQLIKDNDKEEKVSKQQSPAKVRLMVTSPANQIYAKDQNKRRKKK